MKVLLTVVFFFAFVVPTLAQCEGDVCRVARPAVKVEVKVPGVKVEVDAKVNGAKHPVLKAVGKAAKAIIR